jgi:hypothetical protein
MNKLNSNSLKNLQGKHKSRKKPKISELTMLTRKATIKLDNMNNGLKNYKNEKSMTC